ncbi:ABC transporter substrate-binding protein [Mesorhizobium sp. M0678]|uniref:ABC transporter substrate-binding protein n=1 Tax=Mesorhizobium sp. M0678 TaxID=2956985 RepID=UPI0033393C78
MINRRSILKMSGAAAVSSFVPHFAIAQSSSLVDAAKAAGQNQVVISSGSGVFGKMMNELFFQQFTKETGIRVIAVEADYARLKAMIQMNAVEWDIVYLPRELALGAEFKPHLEELGKNCEQLPNVSTEGVEGSCVGEVGVLWDQGGLVMTYDERAFPGGGPANWVDFWDVKRFPGPRSLPTDDSALEVLMVALIADGVPLEKLFPMDLDRAFKKLDELKPNIAVWWTSGDQSQQLFRSREVVASAMWNGRASRLQREGVPVRFTWDGATYESQTFCITKGAPNPLAAKALLNFVYTRPEAHAEFVKNMFYALPNKNAAAFLDPEFASTLVTASDNLSKVAIMDAEWIQANRAAVTERWTAWISE